MISISPVSFLNKVQFSKNQTNFKGNYNSLTFDVFESQSNNEKPVEDLIKETKEKIDAKRKELADIEPEFQESSKRNDYVLKKRGEIKAEFMATLERAYGKEEALRYFKNEDLIDEQNCCYYEYEQYKALLLRCFDIQAKHIRLDLKVKKIKEQIVNYENYLEHLNTHPKTAFLYNPDMTGEEKRQMLKRTSNLMTRSSIAEEMNLNYALVNKYINEESGCVFDKLNDTLLVDVDFENNKKCFDKLQQFRKTHKTFKEFLSEYNFSDTQIRNLKRNGKIVVLEEGKTKYEFINPNDKKNIEAIENCKKLVPIKSQKYYVGSTKGHEKMLIPSGYLEQLGYGTLKEIREAVCKYNLIGTVERTKDNKFRTKVDISSIVNQSVLQNMRKNNENIKTIKQIADMYDIPQYYIENAIIKGELLIIPEYIYDSDEKTTYINISNSQNIQFINSLFERQYEKSLSKTQQYEAQSIKSKLAWALAPKTKQIASNEDRIEGWIIPIRIKIEDKGMKSLTNKELTQYRTYWKNVWQKAGGSDEVKKGHARAKKAYNEYIKGGIEAVSDEEAQERLIDILSENL